VTDSPVVVRVSDVSKRFVIRKEKSLKERLVNFGRSNKHKDDFYALRDVTLDITAGSTVGLVGANGSGKSTLLKAIGGIIQPTTGEVERRGRLAALLELGAGFHPDLTGRENVYLNASIMGLSRAETDRYFDDIVEFSGIEQFIDTQVKFYSSGMYVRLAFAVAVHVNPDILIVDEVLAVGDEPFQRKCMDRIKGFQQEGKTIILVTHSAAQIGELCDRAIVLEHGVVRFDGDPAKAIRILREGFEEARHEEAAAHHKPSTDVEISGVELVVKDSDDEGQLIPGGSIEVKVRLTAERPIERPIVGMGIETPLGQLVFGTNTDMLKIGFALPQGESELVFSISELALAGGEYFVHASAGTIDVGETTRIPQAAVLKTRTDTRSVGLLATAVAGDFRAVPPAGDGAAPHLP
jgi:ABC-2 type transport system ATP-binding protein